MKRTSMPWLVVCFALGTACGGGGDGKGSSSPEPTAIDPCSLVTQDEVADVAGEAVASPTQREAGAAATCSFVAEDGTPTIEVTVLTPTTTATAAYEAGFSEATEVTDLGVGQRARCQESSLLATLLVLVDDLVLQVVAADCEQAKSIAKLAAPNLP